MNADLLACFSPGVVFLEEAGEILEAHIISGTHKDVKHLIMIGDHKQLRPKIENHELSVMSGNGYDLNRSLFERMILGGCDNKSLKVSVLIKTVRNYYNIFILEISLLLIIISNQFLFYRNSIGCIQKYRSL